MKLRPIKSSILKKDIIGSGENQNIGVIDIETYTNTDTQKSKVYAAGLLTHKNKYPTTFYIDEKLNSNLVIY